MLGLVFGGVLFAAEAPSPELLRKALDPNPALSTYVADASLSATLHSVLPVRKTLKGTAYYRKPKRKIVFDNVPPEFKQFSTLAATMPTYDQVQREYKTSPASDDGSSSTFTLLPISDDGRVSSLILRVGDSSHLLEQATWHYKGSNTLSVRPTYEKNGDFELLSSVAVVARFTGYSADGTLQFSNYRLNAAVTL